MVRLIELIIRGIAKLIKFFGLWVPLAYIALGIFLYVKYDFAILSFDLWSILYIAGFIASLICVVIITVKNIIYKTFHKKIEEKKHAKQFKEIIRAENLKEREYNLKRHQEISEKEEALARRENELILKQKKLAGKQSRTQRRQERKKEGEVDFSYLDSKTAPAYNTPISPYYNLEYSQNVNMQADSRFYEQPAIYKSAIDASLLIHEFSDRFVVYREQNGRVKLEKVEYK